jgi:hypothetical protein
VPKPVEAEATLKLAAPQQAKPVDPVRNPPAKPVDPVRNPLAKPVDPDARPQRRAVEGYVGFANLPNQVTILDPVKTPSAL